MIEIVFGESACGSIKVAQGYGKGKYPGAAMSVILRNEDGSEPTEEEKQKALLRAQEEAKREWENAVVLEGSRKDVYCFDMMFSVGSISENGIGSQRAELLRKMMLDSDAENIGGYIKEKIRKAQETLETVIKRYVSGEPLRIWYSHNPDELCGMYWLMAQLCPLKSQTDIYAVKLPEWECRKENTLIRKNSWGDVDAGEWGRYVSLQEKIQPVFLSACAADWKQLQEENAPLRAFLNGRLQSMPEDTYDSFILREIASQPDEFRMARVIGNVLGRYQLGISDVWIAKRMEKMIGEGLLEIAEDVPKGDIIYRRILRKKLHPLLFCDTLKTI